MKLKLIVASVVVMLGVTLAPAAHRTLQWISDAHGLITVAMKHPGELTLDPYAKDGLLISQGVAAWILTHLSYPYGKCSELSQLVRNCSTPLVNQLIHTIDKSESTVSERGYDLLRHMIERGEPLNAHSNGLTPLHEAILLKNPKLVKVLLEAGANPRTRALAHGKPYHNLNAFQFLNYLEAKNPRSYVAVRAALEPYR